MVIVYKKKNSFVYVSGVEEHAMFINQSLQVELSETTTLYILWKDLLLKTWDVQVIQELVILSGRCQNTVFCKWGLQKQYKIYFWAKGVNYLCNR